VERYLLTLLISLSYCEYVPLSTITNIPIYYIEDSYLYAIWYIYITFLTDSVVVLFGTRATQDLPWPADHPRGSVLPVAVRRGMVPHLAGVLPTTPWPRAGGPEGGRWSSTLLSPDNERQFEVLGLRPSTKVHSCSYSYFKEKHLTLTVWLVRTFDSNYLWLTEQYL
jgi:hypothetical protein